MDLWVVAAAAGAGYLGRYWNRLSKNSNSSPHLSAEDSNPEPPSSPVCRKAWGDRFGNDFSFDGRASVVNSLDGRLEADSASKRGPDSEKVGLLRDYIEDCVLSVSKLPALFSENENYMDVGDGNEHNSGVGGNCGFPHPDLSMEVGILNPCGSKSSLRTKHTYGHVSRPLNSLDSCLVAQLYKKHAKMEENVYGSHSSPCRATRYFLVGDGSRIVSRANDECALVGNEENNLHREAFQGKDENLLSGIPSLPKIGLSNCVKTKSFIADNEQSERLSSSNGVLSTKHFHTTQNDAMYLFSLGITFGIVTSILANKREMEKLRELLKQNENLVQDLQEELDMKDSMTVKELHSANYGSQDTCNHSLCDKDLNEFTLENHMGNSPMIDQKEEENSESMSKIEAELEAELERLGLNMNESSLDRRLSELVEVDPDFVADFAQGELRPDMVSGKEDLVPQKSNSNDDDASDRVIYPANYAVSPRELSLRLHEVIESRLEERVQELELALQNSQRKLQSMESKQAGYSQKYFPSQGQASVLTYDDSDAIAEPLVMNSSGDALGATYEESIKIYDSEKNWHDVLGDQHGGANGLIAYSDVDGERLSRELSSGEATMLEGQCFSVHELDDADGDEDCDSGSEMERQLIRQIVERTKKGSHVFKDVRKMLYSMEDDIEH